MRPRRTARAPTSPAPCPPRARAASAIARTEFPPAAPSACKAPPRRRYPPLKQGFYSCVTVALRCGDHPHLLCRHRFVMTSSSSAPMTCTSASLPSLMEARMAGKMLSVEPTIDPSAAVRESTLGAYCEVGARTSLLEVSMGDY